jgi:hypothetical protein
VRVFLVVLVLSGVVVFGFGGGFVCNDVCKRGRTFARRVDNTTVLNLFDDHFTSINVVKLTERTFLVISPWTQRLLTSNI